MPRVVHIVGETLSLKLRTDLEIHKQEIGLRRVVKTNLKISAKREGWTKD